MAVMQRKELICRPVACELQRRRDLTATVPKLPHPMKIVKALFHALVASAFAAAEALLLIDELPIARLWHRRQHN